MPIEITPLSHSRLYLNGNFSSVGNLIVPGQVTLDTSTGAVVPDPIAFNPRPRTVYATDPVGRTYYRRDEPLPDSTAVRPVLQRTRPDGSPDAEYRVEFDTLFGARVVPLADGSAYISGHFQFVNDEGVANIIRLTPNGTTDHTFDAPPVVSGWLAAVDSLGRPLLIDRASGTPKIFRLTVTGSPDPSFTPHHFHTGNGYGEVTLHLFADNSMLLFGPFTNLDRPATGGFTRLLPDGTLAPDSAGTSQNRTYRACRILADGSVLYVVTGGYGTGFIIGHIPSTGGPADEQDINIAFVDDDIFRSLILPDGSIIIIGQVWAVDGSPVHGIAKLRRDGSLDPLFRQTLGHEGVVAEATPLPDGRILLAGNFTAVSGKLRSGVAIVLPDGTASDSFAPDLSRDDRVLAIHRYSNHGYIAVGQFRDPGGPFEPNNWGSILLRPDGARDVEFEESLPDGTHIIAVGPTGNLYGTVPDGRPGAPGKLKRFLPDLTIDSGFSPDDYLTYTSIYDVVVNEDGSLLIFAGVENPYDESTRLLILTLDHTGRPDTTRIPQADLDRSIFDLALLPDKSLYVAGRFNYASFLGETFPVNLIARLKPEGMLDTTFAAPKFDLEDKSIYAIGIQSDGGIIVGGHYLSPGSSFQPQQVVARLLEDGTFDESLNMAVSGRSPTAITDVAVDSADDVYIAGEFTGIEGTLRTSIARITRKVFHARIDERDAEVTTGDTVILHARDPDLAPVTYQWFRNDVPIAGETLPALALRKVSAETAGFYQVEITWNGITERSFPSRVTVTDPETTMAHYWGPTRFSATGGIAMIQVQAPPQAEWTLESLPTWIDPVTRSGTGAADIPLRIFANHTNASRSGVLSLDGNKTEVTQAGFASKLINISTRGHVGPDDDALMITGFSISGAVPLQILGRGVGPSLLSFGVHDFLPDPAINLMSGSTSVAQSLDWEREPDHVAILEESGRIGAFGLIPDTSESALLATLMPGAYTMVVSGESAGGGSAIGEVYDRSDPSENSARLVNISTRGTVSDESQAMIAGFVISGSEPKQILVRGVGPGLQPFGITGFLENPMLTVYDSAGRIVGTSDDWSLEERWEFVESGFSVAGAFPLDLHQRDAALITNLEPGAYTVVLSTEERDKGVALVEVYDLETAEIR